VTLTWLSVILLKIIYNNNNNNNNVAEKLAVSRVNVQEQTDVSKICKQSDTVATEDWSKPDQTPYADFWERETECG
jgi:hypothetical protein